MAHHPIQRQKVFVVNYHHQGDAPNIVKQLFAAGARFVVNDCIPIPNWLPTGQPFGHSYIAIYQHTHEIEVAIQT